MPAAPLTRRLLAALETHAHEDAGPVALADWAALSQLFDRELTLLTRLAEVAPGERAGADLQLQARAQQLSARYERRSRRLQAAAEELNRERATLTHARRHHRAAQAAYQAR